MRSGKVNAVVELCVGKKVSPPLNSKLTVSTKASAAVENVKPETSAPLVVV
jgi:hypothetical protein